jgi:hypothetical protein
VSFAAKVEKLMFTVGLTDKTAGPVGAINARIDKLTRNAEKGFRNVGYGAAGLTGAIFLLNRAMAPAIEQQRALNEVASLDVQPKALQTLNKMALKTQAQYGIASASIVRSAYDIQSAIAGLDGNELSKFTQNSAILAKGTKADASVITSYMGTMYGIFKSNADKMGNSAWVDQLTGQTAAAVKMYKTTGSEMGAAFGSLGAEGQAALIPMHEQMAVLGKLQATMSGSEAGTKYKSFITNVGRAQKSLGLNFTDSAGRMLPIVQIMDKIKGKYGEIDTVAKSGIIQSAFGSEEAVALVKLLVKDTANLGTEIDNLGDVRGMENALKMAKAMTDPWQQITGTAKSIHTAFSQALLPVLQPTIDKMTEAGGTLLRWTEMFPKLTSMVSLAGLAIITLIGTIAALTIAVGIYRFMMVGWAVVQTALTGGVWLLTGSVTVAGKAFGFARASLLGFYLMSKVAGVGFTAMRVAMLAMTTGVWTFTAALLANPLTWVVVAVVAAVAALGYGIYKLVQNWDAVKQAFTSGFEFIQQRFTAMTDFFNNLNPLEMLGSSIDWLIEKINLIPGINIETQFSGDNPIQRQQQKGDYVNPQTAKILQQQGYAGPSLLQPQNPAVPLNVSRQLAANDAVLPAQNFAAQNTMVPINVNRQLAANDAVLPQQKFADQNTVVPLKVDYQLAQNNKNVPQGLGANFANIKQNPALNLQSENAQVTNLNNQRLQVPKGGLMQQFKQMNTETNNNNGMHVEHVTIKTSKLDNAEALQQQLLVSVG